MLLTFKFLFTVTFHCLQVKLEHNYAASVVAFGLTLLMEPNFSSPLLLSNLRLSLLHSWAV